MEGVERKLIALLASALLIVVRQEVNNLESSVVVQELDFAINLALYGLL